MGTGATKQETRSLIMSLEKHSKKTGKRVWRRLAEELSKASRARAKINLFRLQEIAKKNAGRTLVVAGKVLGTGNLEESLEVACLDYSQNAAKKIREKKGKISGLKEFLETKPKEDKLVIVK